MEGIAGRGAMWLTWLVLVALAGCSHGEFSARCAEGEDKQVKVLPSPDAVPGRYLVEYCTPVDPTVTRWILDMFTVAQQPQKNCTYPLMGERFSGKGHSNSEEEFVPLNNCSYMCFSKAMDLMFRSCYRLTNQVSGQFSVRPYNSYYFADNNITSFTRDTNFTQFVNNIEYDKSISFYWYEGHIPIMDYEVTLSANATQYLIGSNVTSNCTREAHAVHCFLELDYGCYRLEFKHIAPWRMGYDHLAVYEAHFCHEGGALAPVARPGAGAGGAGGAALWWWLAALAAAAALAALWLGCRLRRGAKARLLVWQRWRDQGQSAEKEPVSPAEPCGPVLVLYAKDCPAAGAVADALVKLLRDTIPAKIYDLYSPEVSALAARSPGGWVRACLAADRVRVLVLQTPALAALHRPRLLDNADTINLEEPLLGRRAMFRRPQFADSLLQYALQLIGETAHAQPAPPYRKYFLCTVSGLEVDVFPTVVPYTRFELPPAAAALAAALGPPRPAPAPAPAPAPLQLAAAVERLLHFVRDNPGYLADQLVFL